MKKSKNNPYCLFGYAYVEKVLKKEKAFESLMKDGKSYSLRVGGKVRISTFAKAVVFELASRSHRPAQSAKIDILKAAVEVKQKWPSVPYIEPFTSQGESGHNELVFALGTSLGILEKKMRELQENIESHKLAIKALSRS